jgi:uncharacterized membrane protein
MKQLTIEWRHLDEKGDTCLRCSKTGKTLSQVINDLRKELKKNGIVIRFKETKLSKSKLAQSNMILFNGVPLEEILPGAKNSQSHCQSCCELIGKNVQCRSIQYNGKMYEEIPEELIRKAAFIVVGMNKQLGDCI